MPITNGNITNGSGGGSGGGGNTYVNVTVATTTNINLTSAPASIDGYNLLVSGVSSVVVKNQTPDSGSGNPNNGIYVWNGTGNPMTRAPGYTSWNNFIGIIAIVQFGTNNANTAWSCTANEGGTLGTTNLQFIQSSVTITNNLTSSQNTITSNVSGSISSANIINSNTLALSGQTLTSTINGVANSATCTLPVVNITGTSNQINVNETAGNYTLSLPQDINTTSTPTFAQATISNAPVATTDAVNKAYADSLVGDSFIINNYREVASNGIDGTGGVKPSLTIDDALTGLTSGGEVLIYPGTYNVPTSSLNNINLTGSESQSITIISTATNILPITNNNVFYVKNIIFNGNNSNPTPIIINGLTGLNLVFEDCTFNAFTNINYSFIIQGAWSGNITFNNCTFNQVIRVVGSSTSGEVNFNNCIVSYINQATSGTSITTNFINCFVNITGYNGGRINLLNTYLISNASLGANSTSGNFFYMNGGGTRYLNLSSNSYYTITNTFSMPFRLINVDTDNNSNTFIGNGLIKGTNNMTMNIIANYNLLGFENIIYVDCTSRSVTITLYQISTFGIDCDSQTYTFVKTDSSSNNLIISCAGTDTMLNGTNSTSYTTSVKGTSVSVSPTYNSSSPSSSFWLRF